MSTPYAFFQGQFVPLEEAKVSIMTHALHYGTGIFEGIRGNWNEEKGVVYIFRCGSTTSACSLVAVCS